jgi:penicillin-binding protein 1A
VNKIHEFWHKFIIWHNSRSTRKARRIAASVANTAAAGVGGVLRLTLRIVVTVLLIFITTGLLFTCIFAIYVKTCLTTDLDVSLDDMSMDLSSTIWYQDNGGNWQELTKLYSGENRVWVDYDAIPSDLEHAAVAIEDQRFYTHKGVDWYRTAGAFVNMFLSMSDTFGGSTITQQLIKNLTNYDDVTVQRKLLEIFRALEVEKSYTKQEIMTWYLNEIYLGENCYGVESAAKEYFGKDVKDLDLAECASLIGITNNPSKYDPYVNPENNKERQKIILWQMYDQGYITNDQYTQAVNEQLVFSSSANDAYQQTVYSYYVDTIIRDVTNDLMKNKGVSEQVATHLLYCGGYNIYSCINMDVQNIVDNVYEDTANLPKPYRTSSQQLESAIVIIDPHTGNIVALSGGTGEKTQSLSLNRATQSHRPAGSSFKPLSVYAPALDLGLITQNTLVNDSPNITLTGTSWYPKNASGTYKGVITIHDALVNSINTVAAQILDKLGLSTSYEYLTQHFGITSLIVNDSSGVTDMAYAPLALGQLSYGITVREMAQAYTAFVNDGVMSYGRTYSLITDDSGNTVMENPTTQIVSVKANTAANICDMLQDAVAHGTGTDAYLSSTAVAGKTGTTSEDKDRYFVGFSMYYVGAVWTGYDTPQKMYFSGNPAAIIWKKVMKQVLADLPYESFPTCTIGAATDIFGNLSSPSPSPSESPSPSPSESPSSTPTPTPEATTSTIPTTEPTTEPTAPVTTPTEAPQETSGPSA